MPTVTTSPQLELRLGQPEEFARVREFFRRAGFDDANLCRRLAMDDMSDLGRVQWEKFVGLDVTGQSKPEAGGEASATAEKGLDRSLAWCVQVFARGFKAPAAESQALCGAEVFAALQTLGLLRLAKNDPAAVLCPCWLYPADGFLIASDRREDPDGGEYVTPEDVVFPAIYAGTLRFLKLLPAARVADALDLCGGTGIGALRLARTARSAVTADVTERCALFAEFNARLNGVAMSSLCGDLYAPVAGRQFDVISAHPPFVPATKQRLTYRDAGDTGEEITRRIIEGLPAHLRPGGTCVILCVACDTEKPYERRVRDWLGAAAGEFDIVYGLEKVLTVGEVVDTIRKRGQNIGETEVRELFSRMKSSGVRQFVYGAVFIQRLAPGQAPDPLRLRMTPAGSAADFEWLLAWRRHVRQPGFNEWLVRARPRLAPQLELTVRHVMQEGELVPAEFVFSVAAGFEAGMRLDGWVVPLLARLEGKTSVAEVFDQAREDGLPAGFRLDDFAALVRKAIDLGFLRVDLPPP